MESLSVSHVMIYICEGTMVPNLLENQQQK